MAATDNNNDDDYAPSTVLVMLGPLHFEHSGTADVLSVKITTPEELEEHLHKSNSMLKPNTVDNVHVILLSSSVSSLFDESILANYHEALKPGGEVMVHVLPKIAEMPVQPADVEEIRMSLVMSGHRLATEYAQEGGWILTANKPGGDDSDDEDDEDEDNDNGKETEQGVETEGEKTTKSEES